MTETRLNPSGLRYGKVFPNGKRLINSEHCSVPNHAIGNWSEGANNNEMQISQ